ncbi:MAG: anti-sigma factor [Chloroflexi bacterium]|nr:anti-sigma factor [Chloroflexota bacterium]
MLKRSSIIRRRNAILALALLASVLYIGLVAGAWHEERIQAAQDDLRIATSGYFIRRGTTTVELTGTGVAAGAKGTLYFGGRGMLGLLRLQDMPVLPASKVYQLWCIDNTGKRDAGTLFRVSVDNAENTTIGVTAPRQLYLYVRFIITVEPDGGSRAPSNMVVMTN